MVQCKKCAVDGLEWKEGNTRSGWQLYVIQSEMPHICRSSKPFIKQEKKIVRLKDGTIITDPIILDANKHYYPQLKWFLSHGRPTHGYYDLSWLEKK